MNLRQTSENEDLPGRTGGEAPATPKLVNPKLSASLHADYEALQNDLRQANELAADFQRQLAGKSNEFAQLKQLFEKTSHDLKHMQEGVEELRAERHRLANEAMRATAFQAKLAKVTDERDRLRVELEIIRQALAKSGEKMEATLRERDTMIAALVVEVETLKRAMAETKAATKTPAAPTPASPVVAAPVREKIELPADEGEFIKISYET